MGMATTTTTTMRGATMVTSTAPTVDLVELLQLQQQLLAGSFSRTTTTMATTTTVSPELLQLPLLHPVAMVLLLLQLLLQVHTLTVPVVFSCSAQYAHLVCTANTVVAASYHCT